jgi:transcriptional regulator with XRE-family HTH domain
MSVVEAVPGDVVPQAVSAGHLVARFRQRAAMTQADLARESGLPNADQSWVSAVERGSRRLRVEYARVLADAMGLSREERDHLVASADADPAPTPAAPFVIAPRSAPAGDPLAGFAVVPLAPRVGQAFVSLSGTTGNLRFSSPAAWAGGFAVGDRVQRHPDGRLAFVRDPDGPIRLRAETAGKRGLHLSSKALMRALGIARIERRPVVWSAPGVVIVAAAGKGGGA